MRKFILSLTSFLFISSSLMAVNYTDPTQLVGWPSEFTIEAGAGYRQDNLKWSIAGYEQVPNILSELEWKNLQIMQIGAVATYVSRRNYAVQVSGDYGHIFNGKNTDKDYAGNHRTDPFSISHSNAGKGSVYDASGAVGYRILSTCKRFTAIPMVGYSCHGQNLRMYNGTQVFPRSLSPGANAIDGLDTKYDTIWYGPWFGLDFNAKVEQCAYVFGNFEWHIVSYRGKGQWNLRRDLGPFHHKAHGFGYSAVLGGNWEIWDRWSLGVVGEYINLKTRHGTEHFTVILPEGEELKGKAHFNWARWNSFSVSGTVGYRF